MDLMFNELSLRPPADDKPRAFERIHRMLNAFKKANQYGYNKIRFEQNFYQIELYPGYTIADFCNDPSANRTQKSTLMGLRRYPCIEDNSGEEIRYLENRYFINKDDKAIPCLGLAAAFLYSTAGIGFLSEPFWNNLQFELLIMNGKTIREQVYCITTEEHTDNNLFKLWSEKHTEVTLVKTQLAPAEKEIVLRDDHGKDILLAFAKKIKPDGLIEIVLIGTDRGPGMIIRTTGRNQAETAKIAELLTNEYS